MKTILIVRAGTGGSLSALILPHLNSPNVRIIESLCEVGSSSGTGSYADDMRNIQMADLIVAVRDFQSDELAMKILKACETSHPVFVFYLEGHEPSGYVAKCISCNREIWQRAAGDFPDQMEYSNLEQIAKKVIDWFNSKNVKVDEHLPSRI